MADSDSSLTPEKRLLQLIEDESGEAASPKAAGGAQTTTQEAPKGKASLPSVPAISPEDIKEKAQNAVKLFVAFAKNEGPPVNLRNINKTVKVFTLGLAIYFAVALAYEILTMSKALDLDIDLSSHPIAESQVPDGRLYEIDLFTDKDRRNVFIPYVEEKPDVTEEEQAKTALSLKLLEITKDFKLAGISIYPGNPDRTFCMVEDVKKDITSFLKVGDTISGLTVAQIKPNSVILKYENEEIELR